MSLEKIDDKIEKVIEDDLKTYGRIFTTSEEKDQIAARIAKLRASMSPQCNCEKQEN